jgi:hypothetical protein
MDFSAKFFEYFSGLNRVYGLYKLPTTDATGEKIVGKPQTVNGKLTVELWEDHLRGYTGLGIVPIKDGNTCSFGAIDIDVYATLDIPGVIEKIRNAGLPLIPCLSKSGGLHLFTFVKEDVPAKLMREKLYMMACYLGYSNSEIFPKQMELISDRGDFGQWINMPYFDYEKTNRYAFNMDYEKLSVEGFLKEVEKVRWSLKEFSAFSAITLPLIEDGPPCLQNLLAIGFNDGQRNDAMMALCVYLQKSKPESWETLMQEYNRDYVKPSLPFGEVSGICKSMKKKEYFYTCSRAPLKSYCNKLVCKSREFGIGSSPGNITLTNLCKYTSEPPIWFVNVEEYGRLEISTEQLQSQLLFQRRCMESLNAMPIPMPTGDWNKQVNALLHEVNLIEVPPESSSKGVMFEYLEKFCTSRVQARSQSEILLGKPFTDDLYHYFRLTDFFTFLERVRFKDFKIHQISSHIREFGGAVELLKIKGKVISIWKIPMFDKQDEKFDTPEIVDKDLM